MPTPASSMTMPAVITRDGFTSSCGRRRGDRDDAWRRSPLRPAGRRPGCGAAGSSSWVPSIAHAAMNASRQTSGVPPEGECDAGAHHAPPQCDRPATTVVAGGHDPRHLVARLDPGDLARDQVAHGAVDLDQVRVVDRAPVHPPDLEGGRFVAARLVAEASGRRTSRPLSRLRTPQARVTSSMAAVTSAAPAPRTSSRTSPIRNARSRLSKISRRSVMPSPDHYPDTVALGTRRAA